MRYRASFALFVSMAILLMTLYGLVILRHNMRVQSVSNSVAFCMRSLNSVIKEAFLFVLFVGF